MDNHPARKYTGLCVNEEMEEYLERTTVCPLFFGEKEHRPASADIPAIRSTTCRFYRVYIARVVASICFSIWPAVRNFPRA